MCRLWKTGSGMRLVQIRGPLDAPKFKDYILPLIFLKRHIDTVCNNKKTR